MNEQGSLYIDDDGTLVIGDSKNCCLKLGNQVVIISGKGDPEGRVVAATGSLYLRTDGTSAKEYLYVNYDGNTNWGFFIAVP